MTHPPIVRPSDWDGFDLVAFDVDGTLYDQRALRLRMVRDMLLHAAVVWDVGFIRVLRAYRRIRERLADAQQGVFEATLIAETAAAAGCAPATVRAIIGEWIEQRPLRYLADCRYPGLLELFAGLRRSGKIIGILSDYPARAKLAALGLSADHVVSAGDDGVGFLKPHPRGLECLIAAAGVRADATILIGDRKERDGLVARRTGARALIRSAGRLDGWQTFARYDSPLFAPLLET